MGRARVVLVGAMLAAALCTIGAIAGQRIEVTNYGEMAPVIFDHTRHAEDIGCERCHHLARSKGGHRCGACHRAQPTRGVVALEDAAHRPGSGKCWECHRGPKARKKLECEGCHRG